MKRKIVSLGENEFHHESINKETPNSSQNLPTNIPQKNIINHSKIIKTNSLDNLINANSPKNFNQENFDNFNLANNSKYEIENDNNNTQFHIGRWTDEEHQKFIEGILEYGNEWKKVQQIIKTRSSTQARSHAQKFFLRVKKIIKNNGGSFNINEKDKIIENIINNILPNNRVDTLTKTQKEKLLSAISSNIKYEGELNEPFDDDLQIRLDEDYLKYNKGNNNDLILKNHRDSSDEANLYNNSGYFSQRKISIGQKKRKISKNFEPKDKIFYIKKDMSHKASMDLPLQKNNFEINNNDNKNNEDNNINLNENELFQGYKYNEYNKKNNIPNNVYCQGNNNLNTTDNYENKNSMNNFIINNYINVTNNLMNNKYICNLNNDIINHNYFYQDSYNNDRNDSINNDKNQFFGFAQCSDKNLYNFNFIDKSYLYGNQFNKSLLNNFNNNKIINYNENENCNNGTNPFELNFNNFSNENYNNNENERQISLQEDEFIKLDNNNEENLEYN